MEADQIEQLRGAIAREEYVVDTRTLAEAMGQTTPDVAVLTARSALERRTASPEAHHGRLPPRHTITLGN